MSSSTQAISAPPSLSHGVSTPGVGFTGVMKSWWESYWLHRAQRATVLVLRSLDDHTLRDIGVGRSEIDSLVYSQACDRRLRYNRQWR